ncbi:MULTISPECIES: chemotaxis protein CheW [Methylorubrum]|jgi:purine-binding chemotaxis protein CheW|uniref:Positive regulator of CheA protein activity (CheW) n=3 Tax=Methylorubrum TaxID=2282523 RepID=A0A177IWC5_9HYPH|nr:MULTISPECIES: chemotaxis protein CheW [Methylorubrum]ACB79876.1 CheW protein [Methylorubrum populi BJ001]KAB7786182.1 Positive regulator of CheA protein activity (CheW) [Methylorubrum populi]MBA8911122.1 purine-binding chemotaxis protein CheW [Methylorubrum thiocyanatum]OAH33127.1 chemotaxis protein CheW [Methylorubrum populi]PZP72077.1 MAG: chemotaxis protein CheW [Methylorubrum populi]
MQAANGNAVPTDTTDYVTVFVGETMFGLTIDRVHDVFVPAGITPVPLAPREIVGLLNLRGRVVTALCLRRRLGIPGREAGAAEMAIGLEQAGETFALIVDGVGEVLKLGADTQEPVPINLDARWRDISLGVHRLDGRLLVILDVDALLAFGDAREAKVA